MLFQDASELDRCIDKLQHQHELAEQQCEKEHHELQHLHKLAEQQHKKELNELQQQYKLAERLREDTEL